MRTIACICLFLVVFDVTFADLSRIHKRSLCANNCRNKCEDDTCYSKCESRCSNPCNRKCRNSDCQQDPQECPEVPVERKITVLPSTKQGESITKNVNGVNNNNQVDINPNITLTNTISNINNISVPINVTSVNVNNIRVTSTDTRRTDTNITSSPVNCAQNRSGRIEGCSENTRRIVILPYPFRSQPEPQIQEVIPPVQAQRVQTVVQQPILVAPPVRQNIITHQFLPPVQRQEMVMPIPVAPPIQAPEYIQSAIKPQIITIPQPPPITQQQQFMWIPRQQLISQQEILPQQQNFLPMPLPRPCSSSLPNEPCSGQAPVYYNPPCGTPDCMNRYPYVMTVPYYSSMGHNMPQYGNGNQFTLNSGMNRNQFQYEPNGQFTESKDLNKI